MQESTGGRTTSGTMRAVVHSAYGGADVLELRDVPVPAVGAGEVLVRVRAAGVDRGAWHMMTGLPYLGRLAFGLRGPRHPVLGMDVAGVVVAVGGQVSRFAVGDEVFGVGRGTFAEFATAAEGSLVRKPALLSFAEAAAVPVSGVTALQALHDVGRVREGQQVAILGASGGVGSFAVQLARAAGAQVTAVCSDAKAAYVRSLGAGSVLDYGERDFADCGTAFDLVVDIGGSPSVARLRRALAADGTAVIVGGEGGGNLTGGLNRQLGAVALSPFVRQRLAMMFTRVRADGLGRLVDLIGAGSVVPSIDRVLPLAHAAEALELLASGAVRGKLVLTV